MVDTVTLCLSKGLGCPLGALIAGSHELMRRARVEKHRFGGAMRQAGIVAAAGLYALDHNVDRLAEDHARARRLAEGWAAAGLPVDLELVETNFVQVRVAELGLDEHDALERLRAEGVALSQTSRGCCAPSRISTSPTRTSSTPSRPCLRRSEHMSTSEAALDRLLAERQADRLPSVAAAVVRKGEIVWSAAVGSASYDEEPRGDARHAVPHRLDHEDLHRDRGHAALRGRASSISTTGSSSTSTASRTARRRSAGCSRTCRGCSAKRGRCS